MEVIELGQTEGEPLPEEPIRFVDSAELPPTERSPTEPEPEPDSEAEMEPSGALEPTSERAQSAELPFLGAESVPPCGDVDLLFVIDNAPSMSQEQERLAQAVRQLAGLWPLVDDDVHAMIVDTDGRPAETAGLLDSRMDCSTVLGAGRRTNGSGVDCGLPVGRRYLESAEENLGSSVSCVAQVGTGDLIVRTPVQAALDALSPELNRPGGCNFGFLREDSFLVVVIVSDSDDILTLGTRSRWREQLLADRDPDRVLVGGLLNLPERAGTNRLESFVTSFDHHQLWDVRTEDYGSLFLENALEVGELCLESRQP